MRSGSDCNNTYSIFKKSLNQLQPDTGIGKVDEVELTKGMIKIKVIHEPIEN